MPDDNTIPCPRCDAVFPDGRALGGHAKTHNKPPKELNLDAIRPQPECFESWDDWLFACQQLGIEFPHRRLTRDFALAESCRECPLMFQQEAEAKGLCHPPRGAWTPQKRAAHGIADTDDEMTR